MGTTEKDYGGAVHGIVEGKPRASRVMRAGKKRAMPPLEQAAEEEQDPGRALPEPAIRTSPEQFGKFAPQKRK